MFQSAYSRLSDNEKELLDSYRQKRTLYTVVQCDGSREPFAAQNLNKMPAKVLPTFIFNPLEDQENRQPAQTAPKAQRPRTPIARKKPESRPSSRSSCRSVKRQQPAFNFSKVPNWKTEVERLLEIVYAHAGQQTDLTNELKANSKLWVEYTKTMNKRTK